MTPVKKVPTPNEIELRGFNRSLAELEWLLLILILAHVIIPGASVTDQPQVVGVCTLFALFVLGFRYFNVLRVEARWKLTLETWAMIAGLRGLEDRSHRQPLGKSLSAGDHLQRPHPW